MTLLQPLLASTRINPREILRRLWREDEGQDLVEYALIVVLVGLGAMAATDWLGDVLRFTFQHVAYAVTHGGRLPT